MATKNICPKHIGVELGKRDDRPARPIGHKDVLAVPEGIRLQLTICKEEPKKRSTEIVLRCELVDDKDRTWALGDFGGTIRVLDLSRIPLKDRTAVYIAIARGADKVDLT
jgi:hypothetical protein